MNKRKLEEAQEKVPNQPVYKPSAEKAIKHWVQCIREWFPNLHTQPYFLPPLHFNRVPYDEVPLSTEDQTVLMAREAPGAVYEKYHSGSLQYKQKTKVFDSDVRDDRAQQHVLHCLRALALNNKSAMVVISQFQFGEYLNKPAYAAAAACLNRPINLEPHYRRGDFDVLFIHKTYGLITAEIKNVGDNFKWLESTEEEEDGIVIKKIKDSIKQLNKAKEVLTHILIDLPNVNITKVLMLPNVTSEILTRALARDLKTQQDLCECLGVKTTHDTVRRCLLSDSMSNRSRPWDVTEDVMTSLQTWWETVTSDEITTPLPMSTEIYEQLVARFCGPASTHKIHCVSSPRLEIRTDGEAVSHAGKRVVDLVLYPDQVDLLHRSPPLVFLSGPPGTGKTVVIILNALEWLMNKHDVHIVSVAPASYAASCLIEYQLHNTWITRKSEENKDTRKVFLHNFHLKSTETISDSIECLVKIVLASSDKQLRAIIDEAGSVNSDILKRFCDGVAAKISESDLFLWVAAVQRSLRPDFLVEKKLTVPLRCPPVVIRELMTCDDWEDMYRYSDTTIPAPSDGPVIRWINHTEGDSKHADRWVRDCIQCGMEIASILKELKVGEVILNAASGRNEHNLQYRDVLVLCDDPHDAKPGTSEKVMGLVHGLRKKGIPVKVLERGAKDGTIRQAALEWKNDAIVSHWDSIQGLEWKVVVVTRFRGSDEYKKMQTISRCTSQLIIIT